MQFNCFSLGFLTDLLILILSFYVFNSSMVWEIFNLQIMSTALIIDSSRILFLYVNNDSPLQHNNLV